MNCNTPTIAIRKAGINKKTGRAYRPHTFIKFKDDKTFVDTFFRYKKFEREVKVARDVSSVGFFGEVEPVSTVWFSEQDQEVLILPCGKCHLCHRRYKRDWACRCIAEAQIAGGGTFLTLTCSDDSQGRTFPGDSLDHRPFQLFMKRLRRHQDEALVFFNPDYKLRFLMCGEYGELHKRPHYHAVLFGCTFRDPYYVGTGKSGQDLFSSPWLDRLRYDDDDGSEIFGMVSNFCDVCPATISYTVGYVDKKIARTQEDFIKAGKKPEYVCMSRRPGIGYEWLRRFKGDVWKFYNDSVLLQDGIRFYNSRYFPPRYFFETAKITGLLSPEECAIIQEHRRSRGSKVSLDPDSLMESLSRAHAAEFKLNRRLHDVKMRRQF